MRAETPTAMMSMDVVPVAEKTIITSPNFAAKRLGEYTRDKLETNQGMLKLRQLFAEQKRYLDYFFDHIDYSQLQNFTQLLLECKGVIFFSGIGKSGFIAQKICQTLVSTGTKSVFLSPTNALHGDIGIVGPKDIVVVFSKSGATEELFKLVPCVRAKGAYIVGVSSHNESMVAEFCDMHVYLPLERELCPFDLAPVTSTAIQMLFGDTVAIALMQAKNLTREEYAMNHPAGRIGKRLTLRVQQPKPLWVLLPLAWSYRTQLGC